ncbi:phosphotransferase [uncultured Algibacter sp.]|uniref:phosphotransferase n=1 Tax=uncultured Algibacter sp. TaxID=298659 RepID=UPI002637D65D|nr:phosphotransferase [uncultured Algibacter sp.]
MQYFDLTSSLSEVETYLKEKGLLQLDEGVITIEKPGEGNMNVVLRIKTNRQSFILKQSRPYVEKYQQIEAPIDRIAVENEFYRAIQNTALNAHTPKILHFDEVKHILLLEDLGTCEDMVTIYQKTAISEKELEKLISIAALIHRAVIPKSFPDNMEMRQLNHQHIFVLPFMKDNGFSLDTVQNGLQKIAEPYKKDEALKAIIHNIGEKYLEVGDTLLHGDYYPGSWMKSDDNLYIIDPEFGFVGFAEFDLGVMAAHLILATSKKKYLKKIQSKYEGEIDEKLMTQVAGIEIMRRLIGLAQLPLERTIEEKTKLLKKAYKMIML